MEYDQQIQLPKNLETNFIRQVLCYCTKSLKQIHQHHFTYRDVRSSNILLFGNTYRIVDFDPIHAMVKESCGKNGRTLYLPNGAWEARM
jgi:serine/threonine protein kinase